MNFFKLYIGDYQRDTAHLSVTEHGAYLLMLQHYYATEKPLPSGKALHRMLRAETKGEKDAIATIAEMFWTATDTGLVNLRADEEIAKSEHQRTVNRELGKRGGRPKQSESITESVPYQITDSLTEPKPNDNPNQTPDTRHQIKPKSKDLATQPDGFAEFWTAYPRKVAKRAAVKAWKKLGHINGLLSTILQAVEQQARGGPLEASRGEFIPHPATWINEKRWEDVALSTAFTPEVYAKIARDLGMEEP